MAVLEKIRSKGILLLIVIGGAMLLFIVSDFINSGSSFFQEQGANVAKINGNKVKVQDFSDRIEQLNDVVRIEYGNNVTDEMLEQVRSMAWESTVTEKIVGDECEELGITVTKDELSDILFGQHISQLLRSSRLFMDENGQFNPNAVKQLIATLDNDEAAANIPQDDLRRLKNAWTYWEGAVKTNRLQEKYMGLLSKAVVVNPLEAKYAYENSKVTSDILCTSKSYMTVKDETIKVEDSDIKKMYEQKKEQFKRINKTADISYISYAIEPSKEDFAEAQAWIGQVREEMRNTDEIAIVVNTNSEIPFVEGYVFADQVDEDLRGFAFESGSDSIYGPVLFGNTFKLARVIKRTNGLDSIKLSRIVLKEDTEEATMAKADSLEAMIAAGFDFAQLARDNSKDQQTAKVGGDLGWVTDRDLDRKMSEKVFSTGLGKTFRMDDNGIAQIFYVSEVGKNVNKVQLAVIQHTVTASTQTHTNIYNKLKQFVVNNNNYEKFVEGAKKENMPVAEAKELDINATQINGIRKVREAVKWVFNDDTEDGMVSDVIESDDAIIAVAVDKIHDKGYRSIDEVKDQLLADIRRDKKGEEIIKSMEGKNATQLEGMGFRTDTLRNVNYMNSYVGALGNEPQLVAHIAEVALGKTSKPIKGTNAAYIFTVLDRRENEQPYNEAEEILMLQAREAYSFGYFSLEALKRAAKIEDLRYKYY